MCFPFETASGLDIHMYMYAILGKSEENKIVNIFFKPFRNIWQVSNTSSADSFVAVHQPKIFI